MKRNSGSIMNRAVPHGLVLIAGLAALGCHLTEPAVPPDQGVSKRSELEHAPTSEIWLALARAAKAGTIPSTERLAQVVIVLGRNGDLPDQEIRNFDLAFPQVTANVRPLTESDIQSLIRLGQVTPR